MEMEGGHEQNALRALENKRRVSFASFFFRLRPEGQLHFRSLDRLNNVLLGKPNRICEGLLV